MSYTPEFRTESVRLYSLGRRGLRATARQIGVSVGTLRQWVRQSEIDEGLKAGLTSDEKAELTRLRRENKLLLEEKEILRKAALFFARETDHQR